MSEHDDERDWHSVLTMAACFVGGIVVTFSLLMLADLPRCAPHNQFGITLGHVFKASGC